MPYDIDIIANRRGERKMENVNAWRDGVDNTDASASQPTASATEQTITTVPKETEESKTSSRSNWKEYKGVVECTPIDTVDRLTIYAGVNEYKGNHLVFIAKVTDKDFQRAFFSMPAYVWEKAIPILQNYVSRIAEIEKKAMAEQVLNELKRLQELGIDVKSLIQQL